jgi:hypothetical protein
MNKDKAIRNDGLSGVALLTNVRCSKNGMNDCVAIGKSFTFKNKF